MGEAVVEVLDITAVVEEDMVEEDMVEDMVEEDTEEDMVEEDMAVVDITTTKTLVGVSLYNGTGTSAFLLLGWVAVDSEWLNLV